MTKNPKIYFPGPMGPTRRAMLQRMAAAGLVPSMAALAPSRGLAQSDLTLEEVQNATGPVNILGSQTYEVNETWPDELDVTWGYNTTNEEILTKTAQAGAFDAVIIFQGQIDQLIKLDRIAPIDTSLLSNWNLVAPMFREAAVLRRNGELYAVPLHWGYGYLSYNADHVDAPASFEDLMAPELTRKIGIPDDPYAVITTFAIFAGAEEPNNLSREEFNAAIALLNEFRPQILTIHNYGDEVGLFARGDIWVGFPEYSNSLAKSREAGATNLQITQLAAWSYIDCMMLLKDAQNEAAACKFMNNAISTESQLASTEFSLAFPVNDAAIPAVSEELRYGSAEEALALAPMLPGVTVETDGPDVPFQDWVQAWIEFKAS